MSRVITVEERLPDLYRDLVEVLDRAGLDTHPRLVLLDATFPDEVAALVPDAAAWLDAERDGPQALLLLGANVTALSSGESDTAELAAEVASLIVDDVMDTLNAPWPTIQTGERPDVLEPALVEGVAVWSSRSGARIPFGELSHAMPE